MSELSQWGEEVNLKIGKRRTHVRVCVEHQFAELIGSELDTVPKTCVSSKVLQFVVK